MRREDLREFHYITRISNLPSIYEHGIRSYAEVEGLPHESVALPEVQARRSRVRVLGRRPLHEYANLYFDARNPMMSKRRDLHASLCVLRVSTDVLDLPGVVVTDGNASSGSTRFAPAPDGVSIVDRVLTFAIRWVHSDPAEARRREAAKCAEVLVPERGEPAYFRGVYVSCEESRERVTAIRAGQLRKDEVLVHEDLFFL